jgi:hypothetical protein
MDGKEKDRTRVRRECGKPSSGSLTMSRIVSPIRKHCCGGRVGVRIPRIVMYTGKSSTCSCWRFRWRRRLCRVGKKLLADGKGERLGRSVAG